MSDAQCQSSFQTTPEGLDMRVTILVCIAGFWFSVVLFPAGELSNRGCAGDRHS